LKKSSKVNKKKDLPEAFKREENLITMKKILERILELNKKEKKKK